MSRNMRIEDLTGEELSALAGKLNALARELPTEERRELLDTQTIVVKMGTSSLTRENGKLNLRKIDQLARVLTDLKNTGMRIVLISSGAIGCGTARLGLTERPKSASAKQAAAAVGQGLLMGIYQNSFSEYHQNIAQILLTKDVFDGGIKEEHTRLTFDELLAMGVIPIVNENDAISRDEIHEECFGDNDMLSAMTAKLVGADLLLIMSDVEGLFDKNPDEEDASLISLVTEFTDSILSAAGKSSTKLGTGGMTTKIQAAQYATDCGIPTVITSAENMNDIYRILEGVNLGTYFRVS